MADQEAGLPDAKRRDSIDGSGDAKPAESSTPSSSQRPKGKKNKSKIPNLYNKFVTSFENALSAITDEPPLKPPLKSFDLPGVAEYIRKKKARNIVFMVGAGISTSAGVPDFRTPGTGLYSNLDKYSLPDPQSIFELNFFENNPVPFYKLARELFPETLKPTPCHYFMRLLDEKGYLRRVFTQNIDSLEHIAGINKDKVIHAHGSHQTSTCLKCKKKYDLDWITKFLKQTETMVPKCSCGGLIKPDIVFFGESLPSKFFTSAINDFPKCDLLIIIGTSLIVQPFASMAHEVSEETPRLLINLSPAGRVSRKDRAKGLQGLSYGDQDNFRDVFWQGRADDGIWQLAEELGLKDELSMMVEFEHRKIDRRGQVDGPGSFTAPTSAEQTQSSSMMTDSTQSSDKNPPSET